MTIEEAYELLNLNGDSTLQELRKKFAEKVIAAHPDKYKDKTAEELHKMGLEFEETHERLKKAKALLTPIFEKREKEAKAAIDAQALIVHPIASNEERAKKLQEEKIRQLEDQFAKAQSDFNRYMQNKNKEANAQREREAKLQSELDESRRREQQLREELARERAANAKGTSKPDEKQKVPTSKSSSFSLGTLFSKRKGGKPIKKETPTTPPEIKKEPRKLWNVLVIGAGYGGRTAFTTRLCENRFSRPEEHIVGIGRNSKTIGDIKFIFTIVRADQLGKKWIDHPGVKTNTDLVIALINPSNHKDVYCNSCCDIKGMIQVVGINRLPTILISSQEDLRDCGLLIPRESVTNFGGEIGAEETIFFSAKDGTGEDAVINSIAKMHEKYELGKIKKETTKLTPRFGA